MDVQAFNAWLFEALSLEEPQGPLPTSTEADSEAVLTWDVTEAEVNFKSFLEALKCPAAHWPGISAQLVDDMALKLEGQTAVESEDQATALRSAALRAFRWLIRGCTHGFSLLPGPSDCRLQDVALQTIHQKLAAEIGEVTDVSVDVEETAKMVRLELRGSLPESMEGKLPRRHEIHAEHWQKLKRLYKDKEDLKDFPEKCWMLLMRYRALFGPHDEGAGWHMALTPSSFFHFGKSLPAPGSFECNPPFEDGLMLKAVNCILQSLHQEVKPLSIALILPIWPGSPAMISALKSSFCRGSIEIRGSSHCYLNGRQHYCKPNHMLLCQAEARGSLLVVLQTLLRIVVALEVVEWKLRNYAAEIDWHIWGSSLAPAVSVMCFLITPYMPCMRDKHCFLDVASINQSDETLKERGIYGLGGFLKASKELRIMWSPPYLSRLWCIFEVAAYRMANPNGKISVRPLFVEITVLASWTGVLLTNAFLNLTMAFTTIGATFGIFTLIIAMVPLPNLHPGAWFALHLFAPWSLKVNFQDELSEVPLDYVSDTGDLYGPRPSGDTFGWRCAFAAGSNREHFSDPVLDTQVALSCADARWELAVIGGRYYAQGSKPSRQVQVATAVLAILGAFRASQLAFASSWSASSWREDLVRQKVLLGRGCEALLRAAEEGDAPATLWSPGPVKLETKAARRVQKLSERKHLQHDPLLVLVDETVKEEFKLLAVQRLKQERHAEVLHF
eukprot:g2.t1